MTKRVIDRIDYWQRTLGRLTACLGLIAATCWAMTTLPPLPFAVCIVAMLNALHSIAVDQADAQE